MPKFFCAHCNPIKRLAPGEAVKCLDRDAALLEAARPHLPRTSLPASARPTTSRGPCGGVGLRRDPHEQRDAGDDHRQRQQLPHRDPARQEADLHVRLAERARRGLRNDAVQHEHPADHPSRAVAHAPRQHHMIANSTSALERRPRTAATGAAAVEPGPSGRPSPTARSSACPTARRSRSSRADRGRSRSARRPRRCRTASGTAASGAAPRPRPRRMMPMSPPWNDMPPSQMREDRAAGAARYAGQAVEQHVAEPRADDHADDRGEQDLEPVVLGQAQLPPPVEAATARTRRRRTPRRTRGRTSGPTAGRAARAPGRCSGTAAARVTYLRVVACRRRDGRRS